MERTPFAKRTPGVNSINYSSTTNNNTGNSSTGDNIAENTADKTANVVDDTTDHMANVIHAIDASSMPTSEGSSAQSSASANGVRARTPVEQLPGESLV